MTAVQRDLTIEQGTGWRWVITVTAGADESGPIPADLTDFSARMMMRERYTSAEPFVSLTSAPGGGIVIDPEAGTLDIHLSDTATAAITQKAGVYDLEIEPLGGDTVRLYAGKVRIRPEVTR